MSVNKILARFAVAAVLAFAVMMLPAPAFATAGVVNVDPTAPVSAVEITGLDLHDGTIAQYDGTFYAYGTMYGCGFRWQQPAYPWCGFGVSTAPALTGPWTPPIPLFPTSAVSPYRNMTFAAVCQQYGAGCFNPRLFRRDFGPQADGTYILAFNAPGDYLTNGANAYYFMGCQGPAGPCGAEAGPPHGSTNKPHMGRCYGNGDFSIIVDGTSSAYILCTMANQTLSIEQLDQWGTNGNNAGAANLAGLSNVESPGVYPVPGGWAMTYSDPNCGYCAGTATSYATATSVTGPWTAPGNTGWSPDVRGRRIVSGNSCGGQPRTIFVIAGQAWQWVDLWGTWPTTGASNQTGAAVLLVPLNYLPTSTSPGDVLRPQFAQWPCP